MGLSDFQLPRVSDGVSNMFEKAVQDERDGLSVRAAEALLR